jgi:hypothetical protein
MSFQDLGRGQGAAGKGKLGTTLAATTTTNVGTLGIGYASPKEAAESSAATSRTSTQATHHGSSSNSSTKMFAAVSDTILQFQRNVAILNNIAKSIVSAKSTTTTTTNAEEESVLNQQYAVQRDVITQLRTKIERQLREAEVEMASIRDRVEAAQARNAHMKMTRDFRAMELVYKNLVLHVQQRKHFLDTQRELQKQQNQIAIEDQLSRQQMLLQIQHDEDTINLQIMREREEEIRKINQGMVTVNEIYKVR